MGKPQQHLCMNIRALFWWSSHHCSSPLTSNIGLGQQVFHLHWWSLMNGPYGQSLIGAIMSLIGWIKGCNFHTIDSQGMWENYHLSKWLIFSHKSSFHFSFPNFYDCLLYFFFLIALIYLLNLVHLLVPLSSVPWVIQATWCVADCILSNLHCWCLLHPVYDFPATGERDYF